MFKYILLFFVLLMPAAHAVDYNKYVADMVDEVNALRAERGLKPLTRDPELQQVCEKITYERCLKRHNGHLRSAEYSTVARAEGVGWYGGTDFEGRRFVTCYLYSRSFKYAGAALCCHSNGTTYYTLILK